MSKAIVHLVDDDADVRATLARLLVSGGYLVREYPSGADLIEAADTLVDGCILLDINMPEPDGFAVHRALSERSIELPVVMMTGSGDLTLLAMKAGVDELMLKPFGRFELLAVLDQVFAERCAEPAQ